MAFMKNTFIALVVVMSSLFTREARGTVFANSSTITFSTTTPGGIPGVSSPYPSTINVSGLSGTITALTVTLSGINHDRPDDIQVLLVGPTGAKYALMADAGGTSVAAVNANLTFDDAAGTQIADSGPLVTGTFRPTCVDFQNTINTDFSTPAPAGPYSVAAPRGSATLASVFNGTAPNGNWSLYTVDDIANPTPVNTIANGWSLDITTGAIQATTTTLTSSPNPSFTTPPNNSVTFTATVRSNGVAVGSQGTVTFQEGATVLAGPTALNASGQASFATSALSEGSHSITAFYSGTASLNLSSGNTTQVVNNHTVVSSNQFWNLGLISIPDTGSPSTPAIYPSQIFVSGLTGTISKVSVTLSNITHTNPDDLKLLLVGPTGAKFVLLGNVGGSSAIGGATLTLDDAAGSLLPDTGPLVTGTFSPSFVASSAAMFPPPAPTGPYNQPAPAGAATLASVFNAGNPNGTWSLYVVDDIAGNGSGSIGAWGLAFTTTGDAPTTTTLASSVNPSLVGQSVAFTASVKKSSDNSAVTVGTVTFREGATVLAGPVALSGSGTAVFNTTALSEGSHVVSADYNGSPGSFNVSSGSSTQTVDSLTLVSGTMFCNTGAIQIVSGQTPTVYPSRINVTNLSPSFCKISVTISNLFIDSPDDVELLLVSPTGAKFVLLSDAGGTTPAANNVTFVFSDAAANLIPDAGPMTSGTFRPTDVSSTPASFPSPAPVPPYLHPAPSGAATLNGTFVGSNPNGYWSLYAVDDVLGGQALTIANGWCLNFSYPPAATVGGPQSICSGGTTAGLGGNPPLTGTGAWSVQSGGTGNFTPNASTPNATFTHTGGSGPITLRWTLTDPVCGASSADVAVTILAAPATPVITAIPVSPCGGSGGNQASGPLATSYAWTIANGTITSATNLQTVTYTAGAAGNVTLGLTVFNGGGCSASNGVSVPISAAPAVPAITLNPTTVCPNYPGNQASGPAAANYAWTINNGTITGPANQQTVTYVAGASGSVMLGLTVFNAAGCSAFNSVNVPIMPAPPLPPGCSFQTNYFASLVFSNAIISTTTGLAFDGTNYWSCSGGSSTGVRLGRYDASGNLIASYSPGLDFRSVFTDGNCAVLARAHNDRVIYRQVSPGVFTNSGVTLTGGTLDVQSSVVFNGAGTEYIAMSGGVVSRWSVTGSYLGSVTLQGFGTVSGENSSPQNRGIGAVGDYWLTYNGNRVLSVWDTAGNRVVQSTLSGAGTSFESSYSFSYCNNKAFIVDSFSGSWRGYDVCAGGAHVAVFGAAQLSYNTDVQSKILGVGTIAQVDAFLVSGGNPVPTLAALRKYKSVLVYSDASFNNSTNLGNVLADYVDQGGGVVIATFSFYSSGGLGIQGRLATGGYLPFTSAGQSSASGLTMVKDLPTHPILDGVASFNGGNSSYHNSSITTANGAALVAHWSNGQPLVGAREAGPGRVVGLNFYPPSNAALGGGWLASSDGGRLMANALLWAGKEPPTIVAAPGDQLAYVGESVNFNVTAVGTASLAYQWRKNGANLPGATASNFTFTAVLASAGPYNVIVSNAYGVAYSSNFTLTVVSSTNLVVNTTDTGWYDATGAHSPGNPNYIVGNLSGSTYRDWFVFTIPPLSAPIARAELRVRTYDIFSPTGSETYQLRQVATPVATLTAGGNGLTGIYNDLGDGPIYAARAFVPVEANRFVSIPLNQTLRSAVAGAAGGTFAMGGEITTLDADVNSLEAIFYSSLGNPGDVQLLLTYGTGDLPVVGYFTDGNPTATGPNAPILSAGFAPLHIGDIATQSLAGLRILFIDESINGAPTPALLSRLPDIQTWVSAGGRLIVHDRGAGLATPNPFLMGTPGLGTVSAFTSDLDVIDPATTLVTAGPFGILTNTSLDGGSSSAHGYVPRASLPPQSRAILSFAGNTNQVAAFSYPLGAGFVYYSTIPLDCYLAGSGCQTSVIATNLQTIYTPNALIYLHTLNPPLRFLPPVLGAGGDLPLLLGNADNTPMSQDRLPQIRVHAATGLAAPVTWTLLNNPMVFSNGLVRVNGLKATNFPSTFFRALETP